MKQKTVAVILTFVLLLALSSCGRKPASPEPAETTQAAQEPAGEAPWKAALEEELLEKYGVIPEYYEDLGNGIYQVYAEVGGEVIAIVTVDSATGEYQW